MQNERSTHAQKIIPWQRRATKSRILASWLIGVALSLLKKTPRQKDNGFAINQLNYELCDSLVFNHGMCGNEAARYLTWEGEACYTPLLCRPYNGGVVHAKRGL